jgi:hypothetical protein
LLPHSGHHIHVIPAGNGAIAQLRVPLAGEGDHGAFVRIRVWIGARLNARPEKRISGGPVTTGPWWD